MPLHSHQSSVSGLKLKVSSSPATLAKPEEDSVLSSVITTSSNKKITVDSKIYAKGSKADTALSESSIEGSVTVEASGRSQSHQNMQPYLAINYIIALNGIFPARD